ncbi:MAG: GAF domain-containing protein [Acidobacteriota bacterium]
MTREYWRGSLAPTAYLDAALQSVRDACEKLVEENRVLRADPKRPVGIQPEQMKVLEERIAQLEAENRGLHQAVVSAVDQQASRQEDLLASLYVAGFQLHRSLDMDAVVSSMKEILINLVGAASFLIYLHDARDRSLIRIADESNAAPRLRRMAVGEGILGVVVKTGIAYFDQESPQGDYHNPIACIPLRVKTEVVGLIQICTLLVQKGQLNAQDHELLSMLAEHGGIALLAASLHRRYRKEAEAESLCWSDVLLPSLECPDVDPVLRISDGQGNGASSAAGTTAGEERG